MQRFRAYIPLCSEFAFRIYPSINDARASEHTCIHSGILDTHNTHTNLTRAKSPTSRARNVHLPKAGCIVFVVDSANFVVRDSAEFLYDILVHPFVDDNGPPILLLCNKSDLVADGFSPDKIKAALEAEL